MAKLIITSGDDAGREIPLSDTQVVGRLPTNAIPIKDSGSSRQNTRIYRAQGRFAVIDLNSKNGTFVNGERVERAALKDGDVITIGSTSFRFDGAEDAPPVARPARGAAPRADGPLTGSPDDAIEYGGRGAGKISERAIRFSRATTSTGTLRWLRSEISQHSALFRALVLLGVLRDCFKRSGPRRCEGYIQRQHKSERRYHR